jgi:hypothetical protein
VSRLSPPVRYHIPSRCRAGCVSASERHQDRAAAAPLDASAVAINGDTEYVEKLPAAGDIRPNRATRHHVFGAVLDYHSTCEDAVNHVLSDGLASLAEQWTLRSAASSDEVACVQEANENSVTLALGYYSMPGVPTLTITRDELDAGTWILHR